MNEKEINNFIVSRVKMLADRSGLDIEDKKGFCLMVAYACDTDENTKKIYNYLEKDGITLESLADYVISISPRVEIEDD